MHKTIHNKLSEELQISAASNIKNHFFPQAMLLIVLQYKLVYPEMIEFTVNHGIITM